MTVRSARLTFTIHQAGSLKDKRQVCRSLIDRTRKRYNASVAEVATQDVHRILTLGIAVVSGDAAHAGAMLDDIVRYMESATDAELMSAEWE